MNLVLNIYTDDSLTELKRVAEADKLKIPYRVATTVAQALDELDIEALEDKEILKMVTGNMDTVEKIIKATFGVSNTELECIDVTELGTVVMEVFRWGVDKINSLKGHSEKN